jgi:ABC transport system ATP-binding/permease protein
LDSPGISRRQASLTYKDGSQPLLTDLGSTNGTFVDGKLLTEPRHISPSNMIIIGSFLLCVDGRKIKKFDLSASRITALEITKKIGNTTLLKNISLSLFPREFIGLMGPSGCGKSTLMDALNGFRPATDGMVLINELDLYRNFNVLRRSIGHVPQRDILHDSLTVERTLYYTAKLRMPKETSPEQLNSVINEVIETVGLQERRHTQFRQLSGGQQKRLSLAIELITKPSFIFLDEPTSPLDPETTENMMMLFRRLADEGRIVVMVTHKFEKFEEMHNVAILTVGGRLAFFGPPREALQFFGCREPGEIYKQIGSRDPDELSRAFSSSPKYQQYVTERITEAKEFVANTSRLTPKTSEPQSSKFNLDISQWITLTQRYLEVKLKDTRNTAILLAQAPLIALLAVITSSILNDAKMLFIAAIISFWFGTNNAIREIVSESAIYTRERLINLKIPSYVLSKFAVLSGIAVIQCALFIAILVGFNRLNSDDFPIILLILYLTSLSGITMGLFFSALVNSTDKAMSLLPLILIPQLLLSGFLKPLDDLYINLRTQKPTNAFNYQ